MDNDQSSIVRREESNALLSPIHQKNHGTLSYTLRRHSGRRLSASSAYKGEDMRLASERVTKLTCACFTCAIMSNNANNARRKDKKPILDIGFSIYQPFLNQIYFLCITFLKCCNVAEFVATF